MNAFQMNNSWFEGQENQDQVRMTWNRLPTGDKVSDAISILPVAALYTPFGRQVVPLKTNDQLRTCPCGAIFNPYCEVDGDETGSNGTWSCNFCPNQNSFGQDNVPRQFITEPFTTEEYEVPSPNETSVNPTRSSTILFVLDTCTSLEELDFLTAKLQQAVSKLPPETRVGLITIAHKCVLVHQLNVFDGNNTTIVFPGVDDVTAEDIASQFRSDELVELYVQPIGSCYKALAQILSQLNVSRLGMVQDPNNKKCISRPTGKALSLAMGILEKTVSSCFEGRILLFITGPCNAGPGQVFINPTELMHTHRQIKKTALRFIPDRVFYNTTSLRAARNGYTIDLFASGTSAVGLYEMSCCAALTGGIIFRAASFSSPSFEMNLFTVLDRLLVTAGRMKFQVKTTNGLKVRDIVGATPLVPDTTLAVYFDVLKGKWEGNAYIQFITTYGNRIRVTTIYRQWVDPIQQHPYFLNGLDSSAAAVITARLALAEKNPNSWLNGLLTDLDKKQRRNKRQQSPLHDLINSLRQSPLIINSQTSSDETALKIWNFHRLNVNWGMFMLQPPSRRSLDQDSSNTIIDLNDTHKKAKHLGYFDLYYQVVVCHTLPESELSQQEMVQHVMHELQLSFRVPVPEIYLLSENKCPQ